MNKINPSSSASTKLPKPSGVFPKRTLPKKCATTQTDPVILITEENLSFLPTSKLGNDGGMKRDYVKAVNYINSCHRFINAVIEKNSTVSVDKSSVFLLPTVTNFSPLFPGLMGKRPKPVSKFVQKNEEKKEHLQQHLYDHTNVCARTHTEGESRFTTAPPPPPPPYEEGQAPKENDNNVDLFINVVKEQINQLMVTIQEDKEKESKRLRSANHSSKHANIIRRNLYELSKICQQKSESREPIKELPNLEGTSKPVPQRSCSPQPQKCPVPGVEPKKTKSFNELEERDLSPFRIGPSFSNNDMSSSVSESSDIRSDTDIEINNFPHCYTKCSNLYIL